MKKSIHILNNLKMIDNNLSKIRIHKLLYFTYIEYYLAYGEELFTPNFQAWRYGPVEVDIYYNRCLEDHDISLTLQEQMFVQSIYEKYKNYKDFELVNISHKTAPWIEAYDQQEIFHNNKISNDRILLYVNKLLY